MRIQEKKIYLKNGQECILRSPEPKDAKKLIDYLITTAGETDFLLKYPEEVKLSIQQEEEFLKNILNAQRDFMIVAEIEGEIAGNCSLSSLGEKLRIRHRGSIGIAIYKKYWGFGIGRELMLLLLDNAKQCGYEQAELEVVSRNDRAIALYEKFGFVRVGEMPNAAKQKDGTYDNYIIMMKAL